MLNNIKIGIIGCGNIAHFHANVFKKLNCHLSSISSRNGKSKNLINFAKKYKIKITYKSSITHIQSNSWDAMIICCKEEYLLKYLNAAAPLGKPILIEKPITYKKSEIKKLLKYKNIQVGFNRRFYSNLKYIKKFISEKNSALVKVSIPEINNYKKSQLIRKLPKSIYKNSIHIFDLINYLFRTIKWKNINQTNNDNKIIAISAYGTSYSQLNINLDICFNNADNFSLEIISENERIELKPIEKLVHYKSLKKIHISKKNNINRFSPIKIYQKTESSLNFKPGFYRQAKQFLKLVKNKKYLANPNLEDAYKAIKIIDEINNKL